MARRSLSATWMRSARRCLRDYVTEKGMIPTLFVIVSEGSSPLRASMDPALHLYIGAADVQARIVDRIEHWDASFAAVGAMSGEGFDRRVLLGCVSKSRVMTAMCPVDEAGLGGWREHEFAFPYGWEFMQDVLGPEVR